MTTREELLKKKIAKLDKEFAKKRAKQQKMFLSKRAKLIKSKK